MSTRYRIKKKVRLKVQKPIIGLIMGSNSDWATMSHAATLLNEFGVSYEKKIVSAHRTPKLLFKYATTAQKRGLKIIIAGAGGAAHLPGMTASLTTIPVLGVPILSKSLNGLDSLLSIAQMPKGIPVGCLAIGEAGAINAALLSVSILALNDPSLTEKLEQFRNRQTNGVLAQALDSSQKDKKN